MERDLVNSVVLRESVERRDRRLGRIEDGETREDLLDDERYGVPRADAMLRSELEDDVQVFGRILEAQFTVGGAHGIRVDAFVQPAVLVDLAGLDARDEGGGADDQVAGEGERVAQRDLVPVARSLLEREEEGEGRGVQRDHDASMRDGDSRTRSTP